jgi:hypothetical protein
MLKCLSVQALPVAKTLISLEFSCRNDEAIRLSAKLSMKNPVEGAANVISFSSKI